ncbi:MAG: imelysin family protein [Pseudomonadota bacterium]
MLFRLLPVLLISIGLFASSSGTARADAAGSKTDHKALAKAALTEVVQPGYTAFAADAEALKGKTTALCDAPSEKALKTARRAFVDTVKSWSAVEIYQFGPVNRNNRYERLFFWPDRKGLGLRQVQRALSANDETVTDAASLAKKSVALQGLTALEYLFYGEGAAGLAAPGDEGAFRCKFASAVATRIAIVSKEVAEAWETDAPFTKEFLSPGPDDPLYRTPKDVTLELAKPVSGGIERVSDQKLGRILGNSAEQARPRLAPFWLSNQSFNNMAGNLEAVQKLFVDAGFAQIVKSESSGIEGSILFYLKRGAKELSGETEPIAEVVTNKEQRDRLAALRLALDSTAELASEHIAAGAGLSFGFNAADGD